MLKNPDQQQTEISIAQEIVPHDQIFDRLISHTPEQTQLILRHEGKPSISLLKELASKLNYEIQILILKDGDTVYTLFITGSEKNTPSYADLEKLGIPLENTQVDIHNHSNSDPTPLNGDLLQGNRGSSVCLVISAKKVCEFKRIDNQDLGFDFLRFLIASNITPWRNDDEYTAEKHQAEIDARERLTQLIQKKNLHLTEEQFNSEIDSWVFTLLEMRIFSKYLSTHNAFTTLHFKAFLLKEYPQNVYFTDWEDEDFLKKILNGETSLSNSNTH